MAYDATWPPPGYGYKDDMVRPIWTPAGFLARGDGFVVGCRHCGHRTELDLPALVATGRSNTPMAAIVGALVCSTCGSARGHHGYELVGRGEAQT